MAELGALAKLRRLLTELAPAQQNAAEEALRRAGKVNVEHSVVGGVDDYGMPARITQGSQYQVTPDRRAIRRAQDLGGPILDMHTHPYGATDFDVAPSATDFDYWSHNYTGKQLLRTLIAQPPLRDIGSRAGFSFFETDNPMKVFNSKMLDTARFDAQRAAAKGSFSRIKDDPLLADYFDYGGDIGDVVGDAMPLAYLGRQADKGLGRQIVTLGGRPMTPNREATQQRAYQVLQPEMLEFLRKNKYARGGRVGALRRVL